MLLYRKIAEFRLKSSPCQTIVTLSESRSAAVSEASAGASLLAGCYGFCRGGKPVVGPVFLHSGTAKLILVTGKNGKGKTSLLAGIAGMLEWHPQIATRPLLPPRGDIIWVGHAAPVLPGRRVGDLLSLDAALLGARDDDARRAADYFSLPWSAECAALSQGWRRRLDLARLRLAPARRLWLVDEPFDLLDSDGAELVARALREHLAVSGNAAILALPDGEEVDSAVSRLGSENLLRCPL